MSYHYDLLRQTLHDVNADVMTWKVAKGLFKTNHQAAIDYALGYTQRKHSEKEIIKTYDKEL